MQIKKDELIDRIQEIALSEFLEYGFQKASLRKIVKLSGTSIGNFYNYYKDKSALFNALVDEEHVRFVRFMTHHQDEVSDNEALQDASFDQIIYVIKDRLAPTIPLLTKRFALLVKGAQGTDYEGFRQEVLVFFRQHFREHLMSEGLGDSLKGYDELVVEMFIDGLCQLVLSESDLLKLKVLIENHVLFFIFGTYGFIDYYKESEGR